MPKNLLSKIFIIGIVVLFVSVSFTGTTYSLSMSKPQMLSFDGNILYVGGDGPNNYTRIQDAIDNASDGDTVFVYDDSSPYYEWDILIDKSINLIGEDRDTTVIDGNGSYIIIIDSDWVNISGFTIKNSGTGIYAEYYTECHNIIIFDNCFLNCGDGIFFDYTYDSFIISNTFYNCDISIHNAGENNRISNNIFKYDIISSGSWCEIFDFGGRDSVITNNTFINSDKEINRYGIWLWESYDAIVEGNEINGYQSAMPIDGRWNIISHNNFINNKFGISIYWPFSSNNKIINNNFINNEWDAYETKLCFTNIWDGNYWDKWIGLKYPILSFIPYFIFPKKGMEPGGFIIDWHPAKEPNDINATQGCGIE